MVSPMVYHLYCTEGCYKGMKEDALHVELMIGGLSGTLIAICAIFKAGVQS